MGNFIPDQPKPEAPSTSERLSYMVQLDGLRAFAVFFVMIHHYSGNRLGFAANFGVKLFFVLSGFLITSILLRKRRAIQQCGRTRRSAVKQFYIRRFLRIFPLYYFVIAVAVLINLGPAREALGWMLSYTLNIYMGYHGAYLEYFAHFWTLAVEEQYYLF
jgi:peptidoglycan/LPS O-acetylase OafA/YrhL